MSAKPFVGGQRIRPTVKLTVAEHHALEVMAGSTRYVDSGQATKVVANHRTVHGSTVRKLERRGLAQSRLEWPDGSPVNEVGSGRHLGRHIREWSMRWTITRAGMKAIGWIGPVASPVKAKAL